MLNKLYWEKVSLLLKKCIKHIDKCVYHMEWQRDYVKENLEKENKS